MASERSELRDRFAAAALTGMLACYRRVLLGDRSPDRDPKEDTDYGTFDREMAIDPNKQTGENDGCTEIAGDAYAFADAMLAARVPSPAPAGGETYAIDRVAADEWFGIFDGVPPIPENERRMYLAIAAARGKGAT